MINDIIIKQDFTHILDTMEFTSVYFSHIAYVLSTSKITNQYKFGVYSINDKIIKSYS